MKLPAIDLGLMAEHLAAHEGVIFKLKIYHQNVQNTALKSTLRVHIDILKSHVAAMLLLIDPTTVQKVQIPDIQHSIQEPIGNLLPWEKDIALESRTTAKLMGTDNFNSAALMKNDNVKSIHTKMANQDIQLQKMYNKIVAAANADYVPMASIEEQWMTLQKYQHVMNE
jgi:hypothetical protein